MSVILSLQGCMAAGKTTAARYAQSNMKDLFVSYENPAPLLEEVRRQGWKQNTLEGFLEIQRLFIRAEIKRWEECRQHEYVLMDLGADEIEFFTLFYPRSMGFDWDVEALLKAELAQLRQCDYTGVLFLSASPETLRSNKQADATRKRGSFEHYLSAMYDAKREWFAARETPKTEFLCVVGKTKEQVGHEAISWIGGFM